MKHTVTPNGHLQIGFSDPDDAEVVRQLLERHGGDDVGFLSDLLDSTGWEPNGQLYLVKPEEIGALTQAPIIADDLVLGEHCEVQAIGDVWWFPNYMVEHFGQTLLKHGSVTFTHAPALETAAA